MMEESLVGLFRVSSLDRRGDERRGAPRPPAAVWVSSVATLDPAAPHGPRLWASPDLPLADVPLADVPLREPARRRAKTRHTAPLTAIRRIAAAIRRWRGRASSRQQLRELDEHLLKDIGLRREGVGCEFAKPFWHWE